MEENRLVPILCDPANGRIKPLGMIGYVVGVERPEILLVSEEIHDLRSVRISGQRFQRGHDAFNGSVVADDVNPGENDSAAEVHEGIVP